MWGRTEVLNMFKCVGSKWEGAQAALRNRLMPGMAEPHLGPEAPGPS